MARVYDNWERLVTATLRREDLRIIGQRTPSEVSLASLSSFSCLSLISSSRRVSSFNFSRSLVGDSFSYQQILQATDYLSESNLIKHGRSGDLYSGVLEGGTQVVVKKIDLSSSLKESFFVSEMEILGKVSHHHRFVPFLGHCLENGNEKFLVYKHMANKDLSSSLLRKIVFPNGEQLSFLGCKTRLKIAIEVAEGLSYLHHKCVPTLVHRDIRACSILLDDKFEVRLGSLYEMCVEEKDISPNIITRTFGQGTYGTSNASNATYANDVYSFGKVLLEIITGKLYFSATDDSSTVKDWMANVLAYVLPDREELVEDIVDSSLTIDKHLLAQVWAVAFVAKVCLSPKSSERPLMAQILLAFEHIKSASFTTYQYLIGHQRSVSPALVIAKILKGSDIVGTTPQAAPNSSTSDGGTASRNHRMSEASGTEEADPNWEIFACPNLTVFDYLELLIATGYFGSDSIVRKGEFGTVYQAWLQDRSTSKSDSKSINAVRKLHSQNKQQLEAWQSRVCLLGRLSHPNLVKFLGYCLENKELFLVHEFMQSGSLENHLFGSDVQPLSWEQRLKILLGAARGLAFLHAAERQGFYEYFDASDILLDGSFTAKISGFGLGKITRPRFYDTVHPNFYKKGIYVYAPEFVPTGDIPTGNMNVTSDVYGFGVVLVEMLTGLSGKGTYRLRSGPCQLVPFFKFHLRDNKNQLEKIMDPRLEGKYCSKAALKIGHLALVCLQEESEYRPSMKIAVKHLEPIVYAKKEVKEPSINRTASQTGQKSLIS